MAQQETVHQCQHGSGAVQIHSSDPQHDESDPQHAGTEQSDQSEQCRWDDTKLKLKRSLQS